MLKLRWRLLCLAPAVLGWSRADAADYVWVIGGGPTLEQSQAQIESNVIWILEVLDDAAGERTVRVYYTSGNKPAIDVVEWAPPEDSAANVVPLARVYGQWYESGERFRRNRLTHIDGSTKRDSLLASLRDGFRALKGADRALIIFNGHGLEDESDHGGNTIRLWGDTSISAREFEALLSEIDPSVSTRFVFSQCYSGGFERLVHPNGDDTLDLAESRRCGFMAESATRESEGCSASVRIGDYRDYTSYFFAALSGKTHSGERVTVDRDIDGDGTISLLDAHLYAQRYAYNGDLPRSTSEVFLERWQPWYLRWIDTRGRPDNVYGRLAEDLAESLDLPAGVRQPAQSAYARRDDLLEKAETATAEKGNNTKRIGEIQSRMQPWLEAQWPELKNPYTRSFLDVVATEHSDIQQAIVGHPDYAELVRLQDRQLALDRDLLQYERTIAQIDKVLRLRRLGRILEQFRLFASEREQASFDQLRACEAEPL